MNPSILRLCCLGLAFFASAIPLVGTAAPDLRTLAEQTGFAQTGRYAEVERLCTAFQRAWPEAVRCLRFGQTPQGRPMLALVASRTGALTPQQARRRNVPVLLVQGGIHAGEIDGKDAGFLALRQALENRAAAGALNKLVLVFVPVFNIDGHERFGPNNRPNQRGPVAMGWRVTSQNLNLNRDYVKADSAEMQAMLRLVQAWDPLMVVDLHVTDGAMFEHDISIQVEPLHAGDVQLRRDGRSLRDAVLGDLRTAGSLPQPFYMAFATEDDPASGFYDNVSPPRFSTGYFLHRNRFGMLVETHSWKDYPTRVRVSRNTIVSVLEQVAAHGKDWISDAHQADTRARQMAGQSVPLEFDASDTAHTIEFRGYAYSRSRSAVSGAMMIEYDQTRPQLWAVPLRDEVLPKNVVTAPGAGYLVPAGHAAWVAQKLALHGIEYRVWPKPLAGLQVQTWRADTAKFSASSTEGHQRLAVTGAWRDERRQIEARALFVPIAQAKSRLVLALFEPTAPDSLLAWGFFNSAFEQKEAMEDYVTEQEARRQLAADPALAKTFADKLANDPAFADSPSARLEFFARRHPSWDDAFNLYPVLHVESMPP